MKKLTPKQEKFCQEFIKCGNASKSYRIAYNTSNMKPETINRTSFDLMQDPNITARIKSLNEEIKNKSIADAEEIQMLMTKLLRGEEVEEVPMMSDDGVVMARKKVTPKDRIKAGETLAKMRGYFDIKVKIDNIPIIRDNI
jgi:phage terminase small subunit|nr:MAG TPA: Terminase small subunit [Caudoviricetes sp.]